MEGKIDVLKLVRENQEKFRQHLQKMKELEEKDKELDYYRIYRNYGKSPNDQLTTIPEGENETQTITKSVSQINMTNNNQITAGKDRDRGTLHSEKDYGLNYNYNNYANDLNDNDYILSS